MDQNHIDVRTDGQTSKDIESDLVKGKSAYPPKNQLIMWGCRVKTELANATSVGMYPPMQAIWGNV